MAVPFITRQPTAQETERLRLALSTFCDGSGQLSEGDGSRWPGWRDIERVIAEVLCGTALESKAIFDVVLTTPARIDYGLSIKSKNLSRRTAIEDLATTGRVHMEVSNSPAKLWEPLYREGVREETFKKKRKPTLIGEIILRTIKQWHVEAATEYSRDNQGRTIDLERSVYLTVSYCKPRGNRPRLYQLHSFSLDFPSGIAWKYISDRCLRGYDPDFPDEVLVEWYGLSGGQLKYYPRANAARYRSDPFTLLAPRKVSIIRKAAICWPREWVEAGGQPTGSVSGSSEGTS